MQLRDVLTISFLDIPAALMRGAGETLRRDGIDATTAGSFVAGQPVFAPVDADAVTTSLALSGTEVRFLSVLDGRRLVGLIDVARLRSLCRSRTRSSR